MIARSLVKALLRKVVLLPPAVEDVIVNRRLIHLGYGDDLVYYYYTLLIERDKKITNFDEKPVYNFHDNHL